MTGILPTISSISRQTFKLIPNDQRSRLLRNVVFSIILAGLEVISLAVIFPLLQMLINDSKSTSLLLKDLDLSSETIHWAIPLVVVVGLFVIKNIFAIWHTHRQSRFLDQLYVGFAEKIYQQFYRQSWTAYTKENSSESFRKIKTTAYEFTHNVLHNYLSLIPEASICILMVIVVIWIDYRILFIVFLLLLPLIIFYYFFRKKVISKIDESFRELTPKASIILTQGIDSFAESRIYRKENYFIHHFIEISKITTHQLSRLKTFINLPSRIVETIGILCFAGIVLYGRFFPDTKQSLLIFLVMLSIVIYRILPSLNKIFINLSQVQAYAYAVSELKEILGNTSSEGNLTTQKIPFREGLELKSISFQYEHKSKTYLLKDLSIKIRKGDFIVLEGASGTGKTTFIHVLAGLIDNYSGQILIDNVSLTKDNLPAWQAKLGFVPQAPVILQDTIARNIAFGVEDEEVLINKVNDVLDLAGMSDVVKSLPQKLNTPVGENGLTLSGGQRQRLVLARALYRDSEVLLLDEVTNQLDEENKLVVLKNLQRLAQAGKTILLVSHDPITRNFATRIFQMNDKTLIETPLVQSPVNF